MKVLIPFIVIVSGSRVNLLRNGKLSYGSLGEPASTHTGTLLKPSVGRLLIFDPVIKPVIVKLSANSRLFSMST